MKKKIIIATIILGIVIVGVRTYYLKDYVTILKYSENTSKIFISSDSITIAPHFYVEDFNTLGAVIDFESLKDSLLLKDLRVTVYSSDNPDQSIKLEYVSTIFHPVIPNDSYLHQIKVDSFKDFSEHDKTITNGGLPYNKITFFFRTWEIKSTNSYNFKVSGKLLYKGQPFNFEKNIRTKRVEEYRPYRMMT